MNILAIASSYPKFENDSTAPFIESITRALAERGHRITLVLPARKDLNPVPIPGVRFVPFRYAPASSLEVFGYAESLRADVAIRGSAYLVSPLAVLSGAARLWSLARHDAFDVLHAHWVVPNGTMAWPAARWSNLPLALSLHGSDVFMSENKRLFASAARLAFRRASVVTACSEDLATRSSVLGANPRPVTIPYGVDASRFGPSADRAERVATLQERFGWAVGERIVLAVGRLVHKKGFEYLVDAMARIRASEGATQDGAPRLVIAGAGDLKDELRRRAEDSGLGGRLQLVGNVERDELPSLYRLAEVVVVPSVRDEAGNLDGLPNVLLESMASGSAIVASQIAGIPQAITSEEHGILVPEKDPEALSRAIRRLLHDRALRQKLGNAARRQAESRFSWSKVGERFEEHLRTIAQTRG